MSITKSELEDMIRKVIVEHEAAKRLSEPRASEPKTEPKEANSNHVLGCPECFKDFAGKLSKSSEVECSDCGFPLGTKEFAKKLDDCPFCHSERRKIREIRR